MAHILIFIHWFVLVFTFGNVELVTIDNSKSNDFPIEELNGYTLREVFEVGNLFYDSALQSSYINNLWIATGQYPRLSTNINNGAVVYQYIDMQMTTLDNYVRVQYTRNNIDTLLYNKTLERTKTSVQYINTDIKTWFPYIVFDSGLTYPIELGYIYKGIIIDQTFFGISSLSVEQMDYWFNVYQENEQREINDTYDYIENELTINDLIYIVLFALLWGIAIKIVKGVM